MTLSAGTLLAGRYRLLRPLGEGGMGGVYLVEDLRDSRRWALKIVLDDASTPEEERAWARGHFDHEIRLMRQLSRSAAPQARIPAYHDDFIDHGRRCLVMEYIPGDTLEARIEKAKRPLPERDVLRWMIAVCHALEALHGHKPPIILRDLKPGNIMLAPDGSVRLIDFGIARTYKPGQASNTENLGTLAYASPEHHGQGQTDARSDIYSLGATMYHALTGHEPLPLEEPQPGALIRLNAALTPQTEAVIARAMRLDPAARYQTVAEMRAALDKALAALPMPRSTAAPASVAPRRAPVTRPASRIPTAQPATQPAPQSAAPHAVGANAICPRCGYVNRPGARFCAHDGTPLVAGVAVGRRAPTSAASQRPQVQPPTNAIITTGARPKSDGATYAQRATEAFAQGRYQHTIAQAQQALARGHHATDLLITLACAYDQTGRPLEAAQMWERAADQRPDADALAKAAASWRAVGRLTDAQVALSRARQLAPNDPEISRQLGLVNMDLGHYAQAEGDLADALALAPGSAPILTALGRLALARGRVQDALEPLRQAIAAHPEAGEAHAELGRALLSLRRYTEAIHELELARQSRVDTIDAFIALAMAYHATGRRQQARETLRAALAHHPGDAEVERLLRGL